MEVPQKLKIKLPYNPAKEKEEKEKQEWTYWGVNWFIRRQ